MHVLTGVRYPKNPWPFEYDLYGSPWLIHFGQFPLIFKSKEDCILEVKNYDPQCLQSRVVSVVIKRKGCETPIWQCHLNNISTQGMPELSWS